MEYRITDAFPQQSIGPIHVATPVVSKEGGVSVKIKTVWSCNPPVTEEQDAAFKKCFLQRLFVHADICPGKEDRLWELYREACQEGTPGKPEIPISAKRQKTKRIRPDSYQGASWEKFFDLAVMDAICEIFKLSSLNQRHSGQINKLFGSVRINLTFEQSDRGSDVESPTPAGQHSARDLTP